jgi:DNA-directed RNA polymerase specialized sigma subunit
MWLKRVIDPVHTPPSERNRKIIEFRQTHTLQETADEFEITRQRVFQICNPRKKKTVKKKNGRKRIRFNREQTNLIIELYYAKEMSIKDVAAKMKVSNKVIERTLRANQIIIRDVGQPKEKK